MKRKNKVKMIVIKIYLRKKEQVTKHNLDNTYHKYSHRSFTVNDAKKN
jgi:hypothetical protein